ncbi:MAG TPA: PAS domain S-box protein, partial [Spirochaetia bacterium]
VQFFIGIGVDITARKNAERELMKLSHAVENSPVSVLITDRNGAIEYANPKALALTGYSREELIGKNPRILSTGAQSREYYARMWSTLLAGEDWRGNFLNCKKNGDVYYEQASISPVRDSLGEISHFVAIKEDVTERIQSEQALAAAKEAAETASRAKGAFLAHMTHEIRTPMNAILGFTQLLQSDPSTTPRQRETIDQVARAGEHLLALIDDVLEMSKIESGAARVTPTPFDLLHLLSTVEALFRARAGAKGLRFTVVYRGEGGRNLVADHGKLRQVIINLLGNAMKFTERGFVELRVALNRKTDGGLLLAAEVEDSGPGICPADQEKLFRRFEQTEAGLRSGSGTGLGLAICREYVTLLGGEISVSSRLGHGSVFIFHVPVEEGMPGPAAVTPLEAARPVETPAPMRASFALLPPDLRACMRKAALAADIGKLLQCAKEAERIEPSVAREIHAIVRRYDYPSLLALLDEAE